MVVFQGSQRNYLLVMILVLIWSPVFGQEAQPNSANSNQSELAYQLVIGMDKNGPQSLENSIKKKVTPVILKENPGKDQEVNAIMDQTYLPMIAASREKYMRNLAQAYAKNFTPDEMRDIINFNQSNSIIRWFRIKLSLLPSAYGRFIQAGKEYSAIGASQGTADMYQANLALANQLKASGLNVPASLTTYPQ